MREDALAKNEVLFRQVNERIEAISEAFPSEDEAMEFLCECDQPDCRETVNLSRAEYELVRAEPTHFIVRAGHDDPRVEHVAHSNDRFVVVEKEGTAARDARRAEPRGHA